MVCYWRADEDGEETDNVCLLSIAIVIVVEELIFGKLRTTALHPPQSADSRSADSRSADFNGLAFLEGARGSRGESTVEKRGQHDSTPSFGNTIVYS